MNRKLQALLYFTLLLIPIAAWAHTPFKGVNNFYGGLLHPLFIPAHVLLLSALGLLLGQHEARSNGIPLLLFLASTIIGLVLAGDFTESSLEPIQLLAAGAAGLLVAMNWRIPVVLRCAGAAIIGLLVAMDSSQNSLEGATLLAALLGTGLGISAFLLCMMSIADRCKSRDWQKISMRVIGSWIAASAVLVLSLAFAAAGS